MFAKYLGFHSLDIDDLSEFSVKEFVQAQTSKALAMLREQRISPTMSAEELLKIMRGR